MSKLLKEQTLRNERLVGVISEQQYKQSLEELEMESSVDPATSGEQQSAANPDIAKIEKTMSDAMNIISKDLGNIIKNSTAKIGDKDGVLDSPGNYDNTAPAANTQSQQVNEITFNEQVYAHNLEEGGVLGLVVSAPAILQFGGKALSWVGKKANSQVIQNVGGKIAKVGEGIHHKYIHVFEKILKPFMPSASDDQVHKAAEAMMMGVVGLLFVAGVTAPGALEAVKGTEIAGYVRKVLPAVLEKIGFA